MNMFSFKESLSMLVYMGCIGLLQGCNVDSDKSTSTPIIEPTSSYKSLMQDVLVASELWATTPQILSADYAFDGILGVENANLESAVREAGGTWNKVTCSNGSTPPLNAYTSATPSSNIAQGFGYPIIGGDGLPVVFSWPVLPSTVQPTDFEITLNTGEIIQPEVVSIAPNYEYNERNIVVLSSANFGNRKPSADVDAVYPVKISIVEDSTPMMLLGPNGPTLAVGLSKESNNAYDPNSGPSLVGAKLSRISILGESWPQPLGQLMPNANNGKTLYGAQAQYRLRIMTSGGFSPDGVRAVLPNEFSRYFRLHVLLESGETMLLTESGLTYHIDGFDLSIIGLADLGPVKSFDDNNNPVVVYDDCYIEDNDNFIDIILAGDEQAMRQITHVEIPAQGDYDPLYNPGGPGNNPTFGMNYTQPGPADLEPVLMALDNPMIVTYPQALQLQINSMTIAP